jgi:hypothetical protein
MVREQLGESCSNPWEKRCKNGFGFTDRENRPALGPRTPRKETGRLCGRGSQFSNLFSSGIRCATSLFVTWQTTRSIQLN